mgnify:CR=1 FL=1
MKSENITNVFLSYCRKNNVIANKIYNYFVMNRKMEFHTTKDKDKGVIYNGNCSSWRCVY